MKRRETGGERGADRISACRLACIVALLLLVSALKLSAGGTVGLKLVYEGTFPMQPRPAVDNGQEWDRGVQAIHLYDEEKDCVVIEDSACFRIFKFNGKTWKQRGSIPFGKTGDTVPMSVWTTGDLTSEGQDEIIAVTGRMLITYAWDGDAFVSSKHRLPCFADDIKVGDINSDGCNELVLLTHKRPFSDEDQDVPYDVVVARVTGDSFVPLWDDGGKLRVQYYGMIPNDRLVCIADVQGKGHNQLLCAYGQSDVSATEYEVLDWTDDGLVNAGAFTIAGRKLNNTPAAFADTSLDALNPYTGSVIGNWVPVELDGEQLFLTGWWSGPQHDVLLRVAGGVLDIVDSLSLPHSGDFGSPRSLWVDIDGQGKGILQGPSGSSFSFYR